MCGNTFKNTWKQKIKHQQNIFHDQAKNLYLLEYTPKKRDEKKMSYFLTRQVDIETYVSQSSGWGWKLNSNLFKYKDTYNMLFSK